MLANLLDHFAGVAAEEDLADEVVRLVAHGVGEVERRVEGVC